MNILKDYVLPIFALLSVVFGTFFFLDARHASKVEYVGLEKRVSLNELYNLYDKALANYYYFSNLARKYPNDIEIQAQMKNAYQEVQELKERIKKKEQDQ